MTMNPRPKRWPAGGRRWRRAVVATYAQTGSLEAAATAAGTSRRTVCRARDEDPGFAAELEEAMEIYADALEAECDRRAFSGTPRPVFQGGKRVGETIEYSDRLAELRLKALRPSTYRDAPPGLAGGPVRFNVTIGITTRDGNPIPPAARRRTPEDPGKPRE